jgi:hypothetical protein
MADSFPSFHDGYLTGIQVAEGQAMISLRQLKGACYELRLDGVELLQIEDFRQGNIIDRLEIITGREPDGSWYLERLSPVPRPSAAARYHDAHAKSLAALVAGIVSGETTLIAITPSYGADLVAVCREATLRQATPTAS